VSDPRYRIAAFLNGHVHPHHDFDAVHTGRIIELSANAFKSRPGFNVLAIDNGRLSYVWLRPGDSPDAMVTSPMRNTLAGQILPDTEFEIRVISFSQNATRFYVSGAVSGNLIFQRTTESGASLFALPVSLPRGEYSIEITGDLHDKIDFAVGVPVAPFWESGLVDYALKEYEPLVIASVCYLGLVFCGLWFCPVCGQSAFERAFAYLNGDASEIGIRGILLGPFFVAFLLRRLPRFGRVWLSVLVLFPFVLPFNVSMIAGVLNFQFIWGYLCNGTFHTDPASQYFAFAYFNGIAGGFVGLFALVAFREPLWRQVEAGADAFLVVLGLWSWGSLGGDRAPKPALLHISPGFDVMPAVTVVVLGCVVYGARAHWRKGWPGAPVAPWGSSPSVRDSDSLL
jgi:hypothetical protein